MKLFLKAVSTDTEGNSVFQGVKMHGNMQGAFTALADLAAAFGRESIRRLQRRGPLKYMGWLDVTRRPQLKIYGAGVISLASFCDGGFSVSSPGVVWCQL
jgi:hypothetical protein